jgi:DNA-directed RNA polymerase subunit RPC12/RpoP
MAQWVLVCSSCKKDFSIWKTRDTSIAEFFLPSKPHIPIDGLATRCPHCGHDSIYHRSDVRYRLM